MTKCGCSVSSRNGLDKTFRVATSRRAQAILAAPHFSRSAEAPGKAEPKTVMAFTVCVEALTRSNTHAFSIRSTAPERLPNGELMMRMAVTAIANPMNPRLTTMLPTCTTGEFT